MSLEEALTKNNELIERQNALLEKLLANSGTTTAPAAETKPATTKKTEPKTEEPKTEAADGPTYEAVKAAASAWLGEHPKGSAEQTARRAYLEETLWPKLGIKKLGDLEGKPADLKKVATWLEGKAKGDLFGYGAGIFAKPAEAEAASEDEDL